ncbi:glycosyltransferase family 4 protein [Candidatus Fermentibacteria bacterium]|nr:glycosyltransferase family 4 protein [Candidatus Fermentibacteria bacterium]
MHERAPEFAVYGASLGNPGGTGVYLRRLLEGFDILGDPSVSVAMPEGLMSPGEALRSRPPGVFAKVFAEHLSIPAAIRTAGIRLVHFPAFSGRAPGGAATVVTVHDLAFAANPGWFPAVRAAWYRMAFPRVARNASLVLADSVFTASELRKRLGIERVRTVYLCAGRPSGAAREPGVEGVSGDYLLFVGTIEPRKNILALLEAMPAIRAARPGLELVVAGRWGWGDAALLERLHKTPGCRWTGHLDRESLEAAYAGARLLVYPSLYEGFGLPPLEAASVGVPFVIGPAESLKEVYGGVAAASCGPDSGSIAAAVLSALDSEPDRDGLISFAAGFSPERMARETLDAYRSCLHGGEA